MSAVTQPFTAIITSELQILEASGVRALTILVLSGTCDFLGNRAFPASPNIPSSTITFQAGQGITVTSLGPNAPLDGITITPSGNTAIAMFF